MSNLQTYYHFKLDFQKVDQHTGGKWLIDGTNAARKISFKAWNTPVEHPSREYKHDVKKSEGNMLNPICQENVKRRKHPGSCIFYNIILYYDICVITTYSQQRHLYITRNI